jgi:hypothetical protein
VTWTTINLTVVTPLFSGDDPDPTSGGSADSPIRVPSIRGVLRFWFRTIAAAHGIVDRSELWKVEERVFGSTTHPSPIQLRIDRNLPASGVGTKPAWAGGPSWGNRFHGARYLLGQGLWHYQTGLTRPCVEPSASATVGLRVRLSDDETVNHQFLLALWAWLTYGGLGARTRRGFGQLRCTSVNGPLPPPFATALIAAPDLPTWQELAWDPIPASLRDPARLGWTGWDESKPVPDAALPDIPALTPRWWGGRMLGDQCDSLNAALDLAGLIWRNFRLDSQSLTERPGQDNRAPEWNAAIHGDDQRYPLAALGLPVGYYSTRSGFSATVEPTVVVDRRREPLRRASPVWLRPIQLGENNWRVFTHAFLARLLPKDAELHIVRNRVYGKRLDVPTPELVKDTWDRWLEQDYRLPDGFYGTD